MSDSATLYALFLKAVADGFKLGDSKNLTATIAVTDGLKVGYTRSLIASVMQVALSEGLKLSDLTSALVGVFYYLSVTEGLKLSDDSLISMLSNLVLTDGTKLGDSVAAMKLIHALLKIYRSGQWVETDLKVYGF